MPTCYPRADATFRTWAVNFDRKVSSDHERLGVPIDLVDACHTRTVEFIAAYRIASARWTRTRTSISRKDDARLALQPTLSQIAQYLRANRALSESDLIVLGLNPRGAGRPKGAWTRHDVRPAAPVITLLRDHRTARITIRESDQSTRITRPRGAMAALLFTWCGHGAPPAAIDEWRMCGSTSRGRADVSLLSPDVVPGTPVYIAACWGMGDCTHSAMAKHVSAYATGGLVNVAVGVKDRILDPSRPMPLRANKAKPRTMAA